MMKIDTSKWKSFTLTDLGFRNYHGQRLNKSDRIPGDIPFLTAGKDNRGVKQYIGNARSTYHLPITVDMFGNCFFHPYDCAGDDNVYFFVNDDVFDNCKLFMSASINAETARRYAYVDQFRQPDADSLTVHLPVAHDGNPDWTYMDCYMVESLEESRSRLRALMRPKETPEPIDTSSWGEFTIGDLFTVSRPPVRKLTDYVEGSVPFIASGNFNNGVVQWVSPLEDEQVDAGDCITVSPLDGSAFYQPSPFLGRGGAGSAILILRNPSLTPMSGLFISSVIRRALQGHNYADQLNSRSIQTKAIPLAVTSNGNPDWHRMSAYMTEVSRYAGPRLSALMDVSPSKTGGITSTPPDLLDDPALPSERTLCSS